MKNEPTLITSNLAAKSTEVIGIMELAKPLALFLDTGPGFRLFDPLSHYFCSDLQASQCTVHSCGSLHRARASASSENMRSACTGQ